MPHRSAAFACVHPVSANALSKFGTASNWPRATPCHRGGCSGLRYTAAPFFHDNGP